MLFGGLRKSYFERYIVNYWWKQMISRTLPIGGLIWILQVAGHRDYDNNAYAYFYFSD